MRKIDKGEPMTSFIAFMNHHYHARWEDAKDMSHAWRKYILECEQHRLSGYTEEPLRLVDSHIDHFRKRSLFNTLVFDWNNFIVDGINDTYGAKFKDGFVRTKTDNERLINPAKENAQFFFKYELNGNITITNDLSPEDRERALYTIKAFNLNEPSLSERRRIIINTIIGSFDDLSDELILEALEAEGFKSVVEQLLEERKANSSSNDDQET